MFLPDFALSGGRTCSAAPTMRPPLTCPSGTNRIYHIAPPSPSGDVLAPFNSGGEACLMAISVRHVTRQLVTLDPWTVHLSVRCIASSGPIGHADRHKLKGLLAGMLFG
ncbi:hypothetical protein TNIN_244461 [Trichonephila inaurata madagascariensis]|uniref:Uncharacterized protein n=1 Tax=Trichonephila inaurata madagascariensis TaxID=2747483 RepID=A0A8X6WNZ9_9ARAC|nr:hypothetical protein TNIN_244461 [Trichonephila inaurata madagascariensis]